MSSWCSVGEVTLVVVACRGEETTVANYYFWYSCLVVSIDYSVSSLGL